jgi:hypothetical protein
MFKPAFLKLPLNQIQTNNGETMNQYDHIQNKLDSLEVNQQLLHELKPVSGGKIHIGLIDCVERDLLNQVGDTVDLLAHANKGDKRFKTATYLWTWLTSTKEGAKELFPYLANEIDLVVDAQEPMEIEILNPAVHVNNMHLRARIQIRESVQARENDFDMLEDGYPRYFRTLKRTGRNGNFLVNEDGFSIFRRLRMVGAQEDENGEARVNHQIIHSVRSQPNPGLVRYENDVINLDLITFDAHPNSIIPSGSERSSEDQENPGGIKDSWRNQKEPEPQM